MSSPLFVVPGDASAIPRDSLLLGVPVIPHSMLLPTCNRHRHSMYFPHCSQCLESPLPFHVYPHCLRCLESPLQFNDFPTVCGAWSRLCHSTRFTTPWSAYAIPHSMALAICNGRSHSMYFPTVHKAWSRLCHSMSFLPLFAVPGVASAIPWFAPLLMVPRVAIAIPRFSPLFMVP